MLVINNQLLEKIKEKIDPFKKEWINVNGTNCYAYALGIDVSSLDINYNFRPGFTSTENELDVFDKDQLLQNIINDLDNLGIDARYVNQYYKLSKNEWKIAIFGGYRFSCDYYDDYHFLRQTENGLWTHKQGYFGTPSNVDSNGKKIELPKSCNINTECVDYKYIMTLCLRK